MSELTPTQQHPAYTEGMTAAARGCMATHSPYVFSKDHAARQAWQDGWATVRGAMDSEYQRGIQNGQAYLLDYPDHLITPPSPTVIMQGQITAKAQYPTTPTDAKEE